MLETDKLTELRKAIKGDFSIYIDAANLEQSVKTMFVAPKDIPSEFKSFQANELKWMVDYDKLKKFFSVYGNLKNSYFYTPEFGTENHKKFLAKMKNGFGFKLKTKPLKVYRDHTPLHPNRKANFDVELSIDAVLHKDTFKTFILFSGDCDFEYLIKYLRGQGKICLVFSRTGHIAEEIPPACNYYFDIIDFRHSLLKVVPRVSHSAKNPA